MSAQIDQPNHSDLLNLLMQESAQARDDDRYTSTQFATIISVALGLVLAMGTLFYNTCAEGYNCQSGTKLNPVPIWIFVCAPMLPVVLIAYTVILSTIQTLRSYYLRSLERQIHELSGQHAEELPVPSWGHVQLAVTGQSNARGVTMMNWLLVYTVLAMLLFGCIYLSLAHIPIMRLRIFAATVDIMLIAIPVSASIGNIIYGNTLWHAALRSLPDRLHRTDAGFPAQEQKTNERSLVSFLVLPRNQEELLKAFFIPVCFVIGRLLAPGIPVLTSPLLWHLAIFFIAFELLVYQARYLFNDVRDRRVDCCKKLAKPRFPCSWLSDPSRERIALNAAFASFITRLLLAALLVFCILPTDNWQWLFHFGFLAGIFVIAVPYEIARSKCVTAAQRRSPKSVDRWAMATVGLVGLGYGLRSVAGFWLAGISDSASLTLAAIGASLFGSTLVALTWALESTRAAREEFAAGKAHLVYFRDAVERNVYRSRVDVGPTERVLSRRQALVLPWNMTTLSATVALSAFVLNLLKDQIAPGTRLLILLVSMAFGLLAVSLPVYIATAVSALMIVAIAVLLKKLSIPLMPSVVAGFICGLPLVVMCSFRNMCFEDLPGVMSKLLRAVARAIGSIYSWFVRERLA